MYIQGDLGSPFDLSYFDVTSSDLSMTLSVFDVSTETVGEGMV